jgi:hypothetical protein
MDNGRYVKYNGSEGESLTRITNLGKTITAHYIVHASFEKSDSTFRVLVILEDDKWKLLALNVNLDT